MYLKREQEKKHWHSGEKAQTFRRERETDRERRRIVSGERERNHKHWWGEKAYVFEERARERKYRHSETVEMKAWLTGGKREKTHRYKREVVYHRIQTIRYYADPRQRLGRFCVVLSR